LDPKPTEKKDTDPKKIPLDKGQFLGDKWTVKTSASMLFFSYTNFYFFYFHMKYRNKKIVSKGPSLQIWPSIPSNQ